MKGPPPLAGHIVREAEPETSPVQLVFLGAVRFFQQWISPIDGPRCGFAPTCSAFGHQAIRAHGPVQGVLMTADRLLRCTPFTVPGPDYPLLPGGSLYDPVAANLLHEP